MIDVKSSDNFLIQLSALGLDPSSMVPVSGDASAKQFWRGHLNGAPIMLMKADDDTVLKHLNSNSLLNSIGVQVPCILAASRNLLVLEDLGDLTLARALDKEAVSEDQLQAHYTVAVAVLLKLQQIKDAHLPQVSSSDYILSLDTLPDWLYFDLMGTPCPARQTLELFGSLSELAQSINHLPLTASHRDFYSGNLMFAGGQISPDAIHVIDYEDLSFASPTYDLVSLLQDLRREPEPDIEKSVRDHFIEASGFNREQLIQEYNFYALLRALRVLGLWFRLSLRDGKPQYRRFIQVTRCHVERNLEAVNNARISDMFDDVFGKALAQLNSQPA